jgi:Protein of unknown function (DUF3617)
MSHDNSNLATKGIPMRISLGLGIAVLAASVGTAAADEYQPPPMKDGLWQTHSVQTVAGKSSNDMTIKMCQTKELTQSSQALSAQLRKTNQCTSTIVQQSGNTVVEESRCAKGPNAGAVTRFVYSHVGDTASHIEMRSQKGGADGVTVMDMKYLGSCPAGMKPGDVIMPDGKVLGGR